jgi:hypothetical protein
MPKDTIISYRREAGTRQSLSVGLRADGTFTFEDRDNDKRVVQTGTISQDRLKQFGCVYYRDRRPSGTAIPRAAARADAPGTTISITINRISTSITSNWTCLYGPNAMDAIGQLSSVILKVAP